MRPVRLVEGEFREADSLDMLIALNSGLPNIVQTQDTHASAVGPLRTSASLERPRPTSRGVPTMTGVRTGASAPLPGAFAASLGPDCSFRPLVACADAEEGYALHTRCT
jgi:hypothetical protein